jgi:hypothetical protein
VFYTPDAYASYQNRQTAREVERLAWEDRITRLRNRITALNIYGINYTDGAGKFTMDIDMAEALVTRAERSRDLPLKVPEYQPDEEPPDSWVGHARGGVEE